MSLPHAEGKIIADLQAIDNDRITNEENFPRYSCFLHEFQLYKFILCSCCENRSVKICFFGAPRVFLRKTKEGVPVVKSLLNLLEYYSYLFRMAKVRKVTLSLIKTPLYPLRLHTPIIPGIEFGRN